jgi:hypothetical protein
MRGWNGMPIYCGVINQETQYNDRWIDAIARRIVILDTFHID